MNETSAVIPISTADALAQAIAVLGGVSDALAYRAAADDDEMLAMLSGVMDAQLDIVRRVVR